MRQPDVIYFVTFRTADSVPAERIRQWTAEVQHDPDPVARNHVARSTERWLDRGSGACPLADPSSAQIVANAMLFFDGDRYLLDDFVVMPNHVHALVSPLSGYELSNILRSWKRHTSREINKLSCRTGPFWQDESFDHIIRDTQSLHRFRRYVRNNPAKLPAGQSILGTGKFHDLMGI